MAANTIQQLFNEYTSAPDDQPEYVLDFFMRNAIPFNNVNAFQNSDELHLYIELIWQYLNALYKKDRYNDTINNAIKYMLIIDSEIARLNSSSIRDEWYYGIFFFKGIAAYRLRDYKTATVVFKKLVNHDKKNENYKIWLSHSSYGQRMWISKTIMVACGLLLLTEIFFKKYLPSFMVKISLDGIALTGFIGTMIYDYYIKRSFRKKRQE